jgi:hypothetical protein
MAIPCPTPMHIVARPYPTLGRRPIACTSVVSVGTFQKRFQGDGAKVIGTDRVQGTAVSPYGRPHRANDPGFLDPCHDPPLGQLVLLPGHLDSRLRLAQLEALDLARHRLREF